jgi:hypothetical protein
VIAALMLPFLMGDGMGSVAFYAENESISPARLSNWRRATTSACYAILSVQVNLTNVARWLHSEV